MINTFSQISYSRDKGPKIVSKVPQKSKVLTFDQSVALFKGYDFICAVDTNTRVIDEVRVSVVAAVTAEEVPPPQYATRYWKLDSPFCWEFVELNVDKPENFGWVAAIEEFQRRNMITPPKNVAMIIDSDLGNLDHYNRRQNPIFEDFFLPPNITLIYASADTGNECVVNRILQAADSVASQVLKSISDNELEFNTNYAPTSWYKGIRKIIPELESYEICI